MQTRSQKAAVYFLKVIGAPHYKIGRATDVKRRARDLQIYGWDFSKSFVFETASYAQASDLELLFHRLFARNQVQYDGPGGSEFFEESILPQVFDFIAILTAQKRGRLDKDFFVSEPASIPPTEIDNACAVIGQRLHNLRLRRNISQQHLASKIGYSLNTIKALEKGKGKLRAVIAVSMSLGDADILNLLSETGIATPRQRSS